MILEALLNALLSLLSNIPFSLPSLPDEVDTALDSFIELLDYAQTFIPLFFPFNLVPYLTFAIALILFDRLHTPIKWIIDKIIEVIP